MYNLFREPQPCNLRPLNFLILLYDLWLNNLHQLGLQIVKPRVHFVLLLANYLFFLIVISRLLLFFRFFEGRYEFFTHWSTLGQRTSRYKLNWFSSLLLYFVEKLRALVVIFILSQLFLNRLSSLMLFFCLNLRTFVISLEASLITFIVRVIAACLLGIEMLLIFRFAHKSMPINIEFLGVFRLAISDCLVLPLDNSH